MERLAHFLPPELVDIVYRALHARIMADIGETLKHRIVWVRVSSDTGERASWWVCERQNYFGALDGATARNAPA